MSGFVSFVGAGPGDPDLLTIKAAARLDTADAILFDDLASRTILDRARRDVKLVPVGKRAGRPSPSQAEVNRMLVEHAQAGLHVVRLKSGDAGILAQSAPSCDFGQVGERFGNVAFGIDDGNHRRGQFAPS